MTVEIPFKKQQEVLEVLAKIRLCNMTSQDWTETDLSNTIIILASIAEGSDGKDSGALLLWMIHESGIPADQENRKTSDSVT